MSAPVHDGRAARAVAAVGRVCVRHRLAVVGLWILLVVALVTFARAVGTPTDNDLSLPGTDSQIVRDLPAAAPTASGTSGMVILVATAGRLDDEAHAARLATTAASLRKVPRVRKVAPPSTTAGTLSADGRTGWFTVFLDVDRSDLTADLARAVTDAARPDHDGFRVLPGGALAQAIDGSGVRAAEYAGLVLAAVVLSVVLGGPLGAALALFTSALSLVATLETIGVAGNVASVPTVATTLATMVGLGVGIDYSLFLLSRIRELAAAGRPVQEAIGTAVADSGTAVAFAGVTVAVALGGLALAGIPILQTLAWTSGAAVLFSVLASLTLLPALVSLAARRLERGGPLQGRWHPAGGGLRSRDSGGDGFWARQAHRVTRRPWLVGTLALVLLALFAAPAAYLRLGQLDAGSSPPSTAVRQANDVVSAAFGPGKGSPLIVLGVWPTPIDGPADRRVAELVAAVQTQPGVAAVGPTATAVDGKGVTVQVIPSTAGSDPATTDLVHRLRGLALPGVAVHVGGTTAARVDLAERVSSRLPDVIGVVLLLSVVVLLAAFRAPLVALKAAAMDLISIGAAYGVLTAVFTWGWGVTWLGLSGPVPIPSYTPLVLFALLFGLSMDYEVFLLTAMQRRWNATGDNLRSVREGLTDTGAVITAAAAIMVGVFASFIPDHDPTIKMFGVGMAFAIAVDATIVRGLLVPATMALLGGLTWWTPRRGLRGGSRHGARLTKT